MGRPPVTAGESGTVGWGPRFRGSLEAIHVSRTFPTRQVLDAVSFSVAPGEVVVLEGQNGSGKTTLLRIFAGTLAPSSGSVRVVGEAAGRGNAVFLPAGDRMLHWRLAGRANLDFFARLWGAPVGDLTRAVDHVAEQFAISDALARPLGQCSTGQRRRLMFAAVALSAAPVLLLDEPESDLDPAGVEAVVDATRVWADHGGCVLMASPGPVERLRPDRRLLLKDGRVTS